MASQANHKASQTIETDADLDVETLDIFHLRRFTLGDRRLELEILNLFIEQTPRTIAALEGARSDRDWANAAHTLKGSARAVGAWRLAKIAEGAERLSGVADTEARDKVLCNLQKAAAEARSHIAALAADQSPG
jgi:HPt (histidine-containing phosphotransfer) domain-containing protein